MLTPYHSHIERFTVTSSVRERSTLKLTASSSSVQVSGRHAQLRVSVRRYQPRGSKKRLGKLAAALCTHFSHRPDAHVDMLSMEAEPLVDGHTGVT